MAGSFSIDDSRLDSLLTTDDPVHLSARVLDTLSREKIVQNYQDVNGNYFLDANDTVTRNDGKVMVLTTKNTKSRFHLQDFLSDATDQKIKFDLIVNRDSQIDAHAYAQLQAGSSRSDADIVYSTVAYVAYSENGHTQTLAGIVVDSPKSETYQPISDNYSLSLLDQSLATYVELDTGDHDQKDREECHAFFWKKRREACKNMVYESWQRIQDLQNKLKGIDPELGPPPPRFPDSPFQNEPNLMEDLKSAEQHIKNEFSADHDLTLPDVMSFIRQEDQFTPIYAEWQAQYRLFTSIEGQSFRR